MTRYACVIGSALVACVAADDDPTTAEPTTPAVVCDAPMGPWETAELPARREGMGIAVHDDHVYVIGGFVPTVTTDLVWVGTMDDDGISWEDGPSLPAAIEHPAAGFAGGRLWFLGGDSEDSLWSTVYSAEVADGVVGSWEAGEPLAQPLTWSGSASDGEHLFFAGGTSDFDAPPSDAVTRLDPGEGGAYTLVPQTPLPEGRFAGSMTYADGALYVVGGATDWTTAHDTVWRAEIEDDTVGDWEELATLEDDLILPALAVTGDTLLVAGGASNWSNEEYRVWQISLTNGKVRRAPRLAEPRLGQGSVTVGDRWVLVGGWSDLSGVMHDTAVMTTLCPG